MQTRVLAYATRQVIRQHRHHADGLLLITVFLCTFVETNSISNPGWQQTLVDSSQFTLSVMQKQHYLTCQS